MAEQESQPASIPDSHSTPWVDYDYEGYGMGRHDGRQFEKKNGDGSARLPEAFYASKALTITVFSQETPNGKIVESTLVSSVELTEDEFIVIDAQNDGFFHRIANTSPEE